MQRARVFTLIGFLQLFNANAQENVHPFLPELFSEYPNVRDLAISSDGKEAYFTLDTFKSEIGAIAFIKKEEGGWSQPEVVSFSGKYRDLEPAFSHDGKTLYFASNRPVHKDSLAPKDYNIWLVTRTENGWSTPTNVGDMVNTAHNEFYPSLAKNGNIYFTSDRPSEVGRENIYVSMFENGNHKEAVPLGSGVNTSYYEFNAFVAPDESFLLFSAIRPNEGLGGGDLYVSFYKNGWQEAQLLQEVNTPFLDFCPFVENDTGKLYFTSQKSVLKSHSNTLLTSDFFLNLSSSVTPKGLNRIYSIDLARALPD